MDDACSVVHVAAKPRAITVAIGINAPPWAVWNVLADWRAFSLWNPFILRAEGNLEAGSQVRMRVRLHDGMHINIRPMLLSVRPPEEIRWMGKLPVPGLVDGEHTLSILPLEKNRVCFVQHEIYRGILVPVLWFRLKQDAVQGFSAMNAALKSRAEGLLLVAA